MPNHAYNRINTGAAPSERGARVRSRDQKPQIVVRNDSRKRLRTRNDYFRVIVCAALAAVAFFMVMQGKVKCNELDIQIGKQEKVLSELHSENVRLTAELERRQSREIIENYAINNLGMQPVQDYQKNTIKIERKDTLVSVRKPDDSKGLTDRLNELFSKGE